ncbi:hypothetical protein MHM582_3174 [Microbacterium sp. HM58-2]|nr:hypothetical protein MHM582_3174 [Microbacterium sp. HM58-2]
MLPLVLGLAIPPACMLLGGWRAKRKAGQAGPDTDPALSAAIRALWEDQNRSSRSF